MERQGRLKDLRENEDGEAESAGGTERRARQQKREKERMEEGEESVD